MSVITFLIVLNHLPAVFARAPNWLRNLSSRSCLVLVRTYPTHPWEALFWRTSFASKLGSFPPCEGSCAPRSSGSAIDLVASSRGRSLLSALSLPCHHQFWHLHFLSLRFDHLLLTRQPAVMLTLFACWLSSPPHISSWHPCWSYHRIHSP